MAEGFFSRWSRRKVEAQRGEASPEVEPQPAAAPAPAEVRRAPPAPAPAGAAAADGPDAAAAAEASPVPTREEAQALTPESDFRRFVAADVPADVKNTALKKLFADPRFNVQDGLDVYIDDYGKPDPLPEHMLRQLAASQFLKLFDTPQEDAQGREVADAAAAASVAQWPAEEQAVTPPTDHADPDLRLQQDDPPGRPGPGPGPG